MCTASWFREEGLFELFFNRDEQRSRPKALPPRVLELSGTRVLLPLDGRDHGTWIAANEHGLVLCLLNLYEAEYVPAEPRSRGLLVMELAHLRCAEEVVRDVGRTDLVALRPFTLVAFDQEGGTTSSRWDGRELAMRRGDGVEPPLVSSGFDLPRVADARRAAWRELVVARGGPSAERLAAYHASRLPEPGALAVSMARPDACTVSHVHVRVTRDAVRMSYRDGAPADGGDAVELELPRADAVRP
ncbi:MAG: NRDE family protein [Planctomycetota bacterium]